MISLLQGDCRQVLKALPTASVQCVVTSPPYFGLRDYGTDAQIGLEPSPDAYVAQLVEVFRLVRRALRDDGTVWLNLGDSYARNPAKGGSGPNGKEGAYLGEMYGDAQAARRPDKNTVPLRVCSEGTQGNRKVKEKDLLGIPWTVAFALRDDGWYLRSAIVWHKPNPMPESVTDRPTSSYEMVFMLTKRSQYYYDAEAIAEVADSRPQHRLTSTAEQPKGAARTAAGVHNPTCQGGTSNTRNCRNVWTIATQPYPGSHFATMPPDLAERCIKAGSKPGDVILDPFSGAGTTALVADRLGRSAIGIELSADYVKMARARIENDAGLFAQILSEYNADLPCE